ncbi:MAG TPA: FAD-dependent oxidoreductase [Chloroflexota bacterium]
MTARHSRPLVVVGGGFAGVAAALGAQRAGLQTCLVQQHSALRAPRELLADLTGVEVWLETVAWGIWGHDLALWGPNGQSVVLAAEHIILATGAHDRPLAFPGWTLPGVMTAGEAPTLPGKRVLVAGYGQFAAAAVAALRDRAANIVGVLDAAAPNAQLPVRAEGEQRLERVVVADVDSDWYPRLGTEQVLEVDTLVLAFGSLPEDQLARLAGCHLDADAYVNPRTIRDAWMRTTVPGVFVVGDAGGIVGPEGSLEQGRLAGLAAAVDAGCLAQSEADRRAARSVVDRVAETPRAGLYTLADADTVICRCEDVIARTLTERLFEGNLEPAPVIAETRAGMGVCQGRACASLIAATISRHTGQGLEHVPPITPRPPVLPVPLGVLAERPPQFV